jgi:hypothetical protein
MTIARITLLLTVLFSIALSRDGKGKLIVVSEPSNANVWINNQLKGQTPLLNLPLDPGIYQIRIEDPVSQNPTEREVNILADSTTVLNIISQRQDFGTIHIESNPPGADVYLTTKTKLNGKTPTTDNQIVPGAYSIQVVHPDQRYKSSTESIIITGNETSAKEVTLNKKPLIGGKAWLRIGFGAVSLGSFIVADLIRPHGFTSLSNTFIGIGGVSLLSLEITAFF